MNLLFPERDRLVYKALPELWATRIACSNDFDHEFGRDETSLAPCLTTSPATAIA